MLRTSSVLLLAVASPADPSPPVFPTAFSARIVETARNGPSLSKAECNLNWDASKNVTSYKHCGAKYPGAQEQLVFQFMDDKYGPRSRIYHIYGYGPFGNKVREIDLQVYCTT
jgi:hypothetical protein